MPTDTFNIDTNMIDLTNSAIDSSSFPPLQDSYAQKARNANNTIKKPKYAPGQFRSHQPTAANLELASKIFNATPQVPTAEYKYLYFPSNSRMKPSVIRKKLTLVGIDNVRILDAHSADWNAISLLLHVNYEAEVIDKFAKANIQPLQFDPLDPIHLRDQRLSSLSQEDKVTKMKLIFKNNLMRSLSYMRYPTCHSVAKFFQRQEILTSEELQAFLVNNKQQQIAAAFPPNMPSQQQHEAIQSPPAASDNNASL